MISSISLFEIITVVPDPKIFFWIAASIAGAVTVDCDGTRTTLTSGLSTLKANQLLVIVQGDAYQEILGPVTP